MLNCWWPLNQIIAIGQVGKLMNSLPACGRVIASRFAYHSRPNCQLKQRVMEALHYIVSIRNRVAAKYLLNIGCNLIVTFFNCPCVSKKRKISYLMGKKTLQ